MSAPLGTVYLPPTSLQPAGATRLKVALFSALVSPLALALVLYSASAVVDNAAVGLPLASSSVTATRLAGALLLTAIGFTATQSSIGLGVTAIWAAIFGVLTHLVPQTSDKGAAVATVLASVSWCGFTILIFSICLSAFLAARVARRIRLQELYPDTAAPRWLDSFYGEGRLLKVHSLYGDAHWFKQPGSTLTPERARYHLGVLIADVFLTVALWSFVITISPKDTSKMAVYGPLALALEKPPLWGIVLIAGILFLVTATAGWSMLGPLVSTTLMMIFPGMILVPVWTTLTGNVAMPGNATTTSLALASPIVGTFGIVIIALTLGIHWVRVAPAEKRTQS